MMKMIISKNNIKIGISIVLERFLRKLGIWKRKRKKKIRIEMILWRDMNTRESNLLSRIILKVKILKFWMIIPWIFRHRKSLRMLLKIDSYSIESSYLLFPIKVIWRKFRRNSNITLNTQIIFKIKLNYHQHYWNQRKTPNNLKIRWISNSPEDGLNRVHKNRNTIRIPVVMMKMRKRDWEGKEVCREIELLKQRGNCKLLETHQVSKGH